MQNLPLWPEDDNPQDDITSTSKRQEYHKAYRQANKDRIAQNMRDWREANKEKYEQYHKDYRDAHREQRNQRQRDYYQQNKEQSLDYQKVYRKENKDAILQWRKVYQEAHTEQISRYHKDLRSQQNEALTKARQQHPYMLGYRTSERLKSKYNITQIDWYMLLEYQGYMCALCWKPLNFQRDPRKIVVDHDHTTGEVRGLTHIYCNVVLGTIENAEFLHSALEYIKKGGVYSDLRNLTRELGETNT